MSEIPIRNRAGETIAHVLVDEADLEWAMRYRWSLGTHGYAYRGTSQRRDGKLLWQRTYLMHRELLGLRHGDPRESDHINLNKLDNRRSNLRIATSAQNKQNRGPARGSRSGLRGVSFHEGADRWRAVVELDGKRHHLGFFDRPEIAAAVASDFRAKHMPFSSDAAEAGRTR